MFVATIIVCMSLAATDCTITFGSKLFTDRDTCDLLVTQQAIRARTRAPIARGGCAELDGIDDTRIGGRAEPPRGDDRL
jgi:hypothetical protein